MDKKKKPQRFILTFSILNSLKLPNVLALGLIKGLALGLAIRLNVRLAIPFNIWKKQCKFIMPCDVRSSPTGYRDTVWLP